MELTVDIPYSSRVYVPLLSLALPPQQRLDDGCKHGKLTAAAAVAMQDVSHPLPLKQLKSYGAAEESIGTMHVSLARRWL